LYRLRVQDVTASVIRSISDTVLEDAASVGVLVNLSEPHAGTAGDIANEFSTRIHVRLVRAAGLRRPDMSRGGLTSPFAVIAHGGREVYRTATIENTQNPKWVHDSGVTIAIIDPENASSSQDVTIEVMDAIAGSLGVATIAVAELLDTTLHGQTHALSFEERGEVFIEWSISTTDSGEDVSATDVANAMTTVALRVEEDSDNDQAEDAPPALEFPFVVEIGALSAANLAETEVGSSLGFKQDLYVRAKLAAHSTKTQTKKSAGVQGTWPDEVLCVAAKAESLFAGELALTVMNDNSPLSDVVVGFATVRELEQCSTNQRLGRSRSCCRVPRINLTEGL